MANIIYSDKEDTLQQHVPDNIHYEGILTKKTTQALSIKDSA